MSGEAKAEYTAVNIMDVEQAIRLLDPKTSADEIAKIEYYNGFKGKEAVIAAINEACEMAVNVMRQKLEEFERSM